MPELTLKFNLPEETEESRIALAAQDLHTVIFDLKQDLRSKLKHGAYKADEDKMLEEINEMLIRLLNENNVINLF